MSISSQINRINTNVSNAYTTLESMGADMPSAQNTNNLAETVLSIKAVRYDAQTLTDAQKAQARANIGVIGESLHSVTSLTVKDAGSSTSGAYLATKWAVANVDGITTPTNGMTIALRVPAAGTSGGILLSINNGTTYYPIVRNVNTMVTTHYGAGASLILTFNSTRTAEVYTTAGTKATITGCWQIADYDSDTKTRSSNNAGKKMFIIGATAQSTSGQTTYSNSNCYIGTNNRLYSGGELVMNNAEITALIQEQLGVIENGSY